MKRYGNLWDTITDFDNLVHAHKQARRGKAHYREVQMVNSDLENYIRWIQEELKNKTFNTSDYEIMDRWDGRKMRVIYKLPYFPDRIVQHAVVQVCEPFWKSSFIRDTYQSIVGRGTHDARKRVEKYVKGNSGLYALKFDIHKYYPNVNHDILKKEIRRRIKCPHALWLLDNIIDSGDGIPIGNYTSQYFGNIYLHRFDWWVKQELKLYGYFRYCDDIVLLANSSYEAHRLRKQIFSKLNCEYCLDIKPDWQVFPIDDRGLDFVGYVFKSDGTRLRKSIADGIKNKKNNITKSPKQMTHYQIANGMGSYWGWCKHVQAKRYWYDNVTRPVWSRVEQSKEAIKEIQRCESLLKTS